MHGAQPSGIMNYFSQLQTVCMCYLLQNETACIITHYLLMD